jgi:hypothetical protein
MLDSIVVDPVAREKGRNRISRVLGGEDVDCLPIVCGIPSLGQTGCSQYSFKEQFEDGAKMLIEHIPAMAMAAASGADGVVCMRPNFGVVFMPALFGLEWEFRDGAWPWPAGHMSREQLEPLLEPESRADLMRSLQGRDLMARAADYARYFAEQLGDRARVYLPDTQGPFDLAHLLRGNDLFLDMYDDPEFVHDLMALVTDVFIEITRTLKRVLGEADTECYHGHGMSSGIYMSNGGTRLSEDTVTLLSRRDIDEFVIPYTERALAAFGGGFVHYCGTNPGFFDALLELDLVRAINLGNPEMHDMPSIISKLMDRGRAYFGPIPLEPGEGLRAYLSRVARLTGGEKRGLVFVPDPAVYEEAAPDIVVSEWREVQASLR